MSILKEGFPFIFLPAAAGAAILIVILKFSNSLLVTGFITGGALLVFSVFCMFFFRDPNITITQGDKLILSPCNGTVMELADEDNGKIIRVFLSVFSVHLQRSPVSGVVTSVTHKDGKYFAAWNPSAQAENEQNIITIQAEDGVYTVRQIAGFLARRCVSWVKTGDVLKKGDKIGMIKFGSQVDLHLPKSAVISIKPGDKTEAGITILGTSG
ncbi:MAG: phosphatidylserine decarboxylase [Treponema sp.]|nr:phosphatidylserine decarboxylase [Treponema sp.]